LHIPWAFAGPAAQHFEKASINFRLKVDVQGSPHLSSHVGTKSVCQVNHPSPVETI